MEKETEEMIKAVTLAGILGTMTAAIRAVLTKGESLGQKLRTFFAGVVLAAFAGFILHDSGMGEMWKGLITGACGAFVSTIWPILERGVAKITQKKIDDVDKKI